MATLLMTSVALMTLISGTDRAQKKSDSQAAIGAALGGASGAIVGGLIFGPIGAIFGGFAGATIGATALVPEPVNLYVANHPVEPVNFDGHLGVGSELGTEMQLYPVPDSDFSYFYANGRAYVVEPGTRVIVYSPGYVVSESAVAYIRANPLQSQSVEGEVVAGYSVPQSIAVWGMPDHPAYAYAYFNGCAALVDADTRLIVWMDA